MYEQDDLNQLIRLGTARRRVKVRRAEWPHVAEQVILPLLNYRAENMMNRGDGDSLKPTVSQGQDVVTLQFPTQELSFGEVEIGASLSFRLLRGGAVEVTYRPWHLQSAECQVRHLHRYDNPRDLLGLEVQRHLKWFLESAVSEHPDVLDCDEPGPVLVHVGSLHASS